MELVATHLSVSRIIKITYSLYIILPLSSARFKIRTFLVYKYSVINSKFPVLLAEGGRYIGGIGG